MRKNDIYYPKMLNFVLSWEGGYSNDPEDLGGETNKGITHTTYNSYRRSKGLPIQSVKNISDKEMQDIYYNNYYKASGASEIENPRLAMIVFDTAVNMGVSVAKDLYKKSGDNLEKFEKLRMDKYQSYVDAKPKQKRFMEGWTRRVANCVDFSKTTLPTTRTVPYELGIEMDVDQNGNVIYYYDMDDYRNMNRDDFKRNFPKIYQQTINQIGRPTGGAASVDSGCAGTYKVSGYVRSDGVKVSSYERTCGAKHLGPQSASDKYRGLGFDKMTESEMNELLDELI